MKISLKHHRYYRSVVLPAWAGKLDMSEDAAHLCLMSTFYGIPWDSPDMPSMAFFTWNEAAHYIRFCGKAAENEGFLIEPLIPANMRLIFNEDGSTPPNTPKVSQLERVYRDCGAS